MSLPESLSQALERIAVFNTGTRECHVQHGRRQLDCELWALDKLACSITDLRLATDELGDASIDQLRAVADGLSRRLTYLLEPIGATEIDRENYAVQLRSTEPSREGDAHGYYELLVRRGGEVALRRYSAAPGQPRQAVPAEVTRQVLARLVGDFEAVLDTLAQKPRRR